MQPVAVALFKQRPRYIQLMGELGPTAITRIVRERKKEPPAREFDFSRAAIEENRRDGYAQTQQALKRDERKPATARGDKIVDRELVKPLRLEE